MQRMRCMQRMAVEHVAGCPRCGCGCEHECSEAEFVVRRALQRFSQGNLLKKTIFELIAAELLKAAAVPESLQVRCPCHTY